MRERAKESWAPSDRVHLKRGTRIRVKVAHRGRKSCKCRQLTASNPSQATRKPFIGVVIVGRNA